MKRVLFGGSLLLFTLMLSACGVVEDMYRPAGVSDQAWSEWKGIDDEGRAPLCRLIEIQMDARKQMERLADDRTLPASQRLAYLQEARAMMEDRQTSDLHQICSLNGYYD